MPAPPPDGHTRLLLTIIRFAGLFVIVLGYYLSGSFRQSIPAQVAGIALMLLGSVIIIFAGRFLPSGGGPDRQ